MIIPIKQQSRRKDHFFRQLADKVLPVGCRLHLIGTHYFLVTLHLLLSALLLTYLLRKGLWVRNHLSNIIYNSGWSLHLNPPPVTSSGGLCIRRVKLMVW